MEKKFSTSGKKCVSKPRLSRKRPGCIRLFVCPTTGGRLEISVSPRESILGLKTALARKLKTNPARITLIYKEKTLSSGRLVDYSIPEDGVLTLLPTMETGLSLHQSEKSITQALQNLSETQINDFLSGRAPLMLAVRLGDSMVFLNLQLSASRPNISDTARVNPRAASILSDGALSASFAQATRCLSKRIHHLQGKTPSTSHTSMPESRGLNGPSNVSIINKNLSSSTLASSSSSSSRLSSSNQTPVTNLPTSKPSILPPIPIVPCSTSPSSTSSSSNSLPSPPPSPGAVMHSFNHEGSGVYRGTFSGTLDSSLQDSNGRPHRNLSTILHILNDLLIATSPNSPVATATSPATSPANQQKPQQVFFGPNSTITPPPSPAQTDTPACGSFPMPPSDNELLRGKMHRVQMMLAQRKEKRGIRRQSSLPYSKPYSTNSLANSRLSKCSTCRSAPMTKSTLGPKSCDVNPHSPSSTVLTKPLPSTSQDETSNALPALCPHMDDDADCCPSYNAQGMEHDSLVV